MHHLHSCVGESRIHVGGSASVGHVIQDVVVVLLLTIEVNTLYVGNLICTGIIVRVVLSRIVIDKAILVRVVVGLV